MIPEKNILISRISEMLPGYKVWIHPYSVVLLNDGRILIDGSVEISHKPQSDDDVRVTKLDNGKFDLFVPGKCQYKWIPEEELPWGDENYYEVDLSKKENKVMKTYIGMVLDESGSMALIRDTVISSFNEYLEDRKKDEGENYFTLIKFNTQYKKVCTNLTPKNVDKLTTNSYTPSGMTALYDALGRTINEIDAVLEKDDRVLIVILTDGQENSSVEYTRETIFSLIKEKEATGRYTFVYLGATQDAWLAAGGLGIAVQNTVQFDHNNWGSVMRSVSDGTTVYASSNDIASQNFVGYNTEAYKEAGAVIKEEDGDGQGRCK